MPKKLLTISIPGSRNERLGMGGVRSVSHFLLWLNAFLLSFLKADSLSSGAFNLMTSVRKRLWDTASKYLLKSVLSDECLLETGV